MPYLIVYVRPSACCVGLGRQARCSCVVGRSGVFARSGDIPAHLYEQVEPGAVLPLRAMYADLVRRQPGPPDAPVCGPHQNDGNPTLDVSECPGVGLPPICCKEAGYPFQGSSCINIHHPSTYLHVLEKGCHHFVVSRLAILFRIAAVSTPSSPSTRVKKIGGNVSVKYLSLIPIEKNAFG